MITEADLSELNQLIHHFIEADRVRERLHFSFDTGYVDFQKISMAGSAYSRSFQSLICCCCRGRSHVEIGGEMRVRFAE